MEELYILLSERASHLQEIHFRLASLPAYLSSNTTELKSNPNNKPREYSEFLKSLNQIKKSEKMRIIKEDELVDIVFNLKSFDPPQRQRFQEKSLETLKQLRKDFVYKKPRNTNDIKDIASLYLNYFFFTGMSHKVEDLKRTYVDNKLRGFPIISVLFKWLVEMSRENFKTVIKDATQDYESKLSVPGRSEKTPTRMQSPKSGRFLITSSKPQRTLEDEPLNEKIPTEEFEPLSASKKVHRHPLFSSSGNLSRLDRYKEMMVKENSSLVLEAMPLSCSHGPKQVTVSNSFSGLNDFQLASVKQFRASSSAMLPVKKKNPLIQVILDVSSSVSGNNIRNCLDLLVDDLDVTYIPTLNFSVGIQKHTKRTKGPSFLTVDTDKKKEAISQVYKNLYSRNGDVEKTLTGFYFKNLQEGKITYTTHVANKRGDAFLDEYTVDYFEKFYATFVPNTSNQSQVLPDTPSVSSSLNSSQIKKARKQLKTPSAILSQQGGGMRQNKRPSTALIIKGARSSNTLSPGPVGVRKLPSQEIPELNLNDNVYMVNSNVIIENKNSQETKKEERNDDDEEKMMMVKGSNKKHKPVDFSKMEVFLENSEQDEKSEKMLYMPDSSSSENCFRILKVANFLHKVSPIMKTEKEQLRLKYGDEARNISPIVTNLLGKLYSTSTKTQESDEGNSPKTSSPAPNFIRGQHYLIKPNDEEVSCEKSASITISKIKPNKIPPSMDRKSSKDGSCKSSPQQVLYKSVKFPDVAISRKPSKEKSMLLEIDTSSKVVIVQRKKSIDNEEVRKKRFGAAKEEKPGEVQIEGKMNTDVRKHLRRVKTSHQNGVRG